MVERRREWNDITTLRRHTWSNDVGVACQHHVWAAHTLERRRASHYITSFGQSTRSNNVGCDMPSAPLESAHGRTTSGVACHHHLWAAHTSNYVGRGMPSSPLGSTNGRTTSGVACQHHLWAAHTVERRRAWHAITALEKHTWSNDVGRSMTSLPLERTHDQQRRAWHDITAFR